MGITNLHPILNHLTHYHRRFLRRGICRPYKNCTRDLSDARDKKPRFKMSRSVDELRKSESMSDIFELYHREARLYKKSKMNANNLFGSLYTEQLIAMGLLHRGFSLDPTYFPKSILELDTIKVDIQHEEGRRVVEGLTHVNLRLENLAKKQTEIVSDCMIKKIVGNSMYLYVKLNQYKKLSLLDYPLLVEALRDSKRKTEVQLDTNTCKELSWSTKSPFVMGYNKKSDVSTFFQYGEYQKELTPNINFLDSTRHKTVNDNLAEDASVPIDKPAIKNDSYSQTEVLHRCRQILHPLTMIHGPPGTGKTKTLVTAALDAVARGERVLMLTPTNSATNHVASEMYRQWTGKFGKPPNKSEVELRSNREIPKGQREKDIQYNWADIEDLHKVAEELNELRKEIITADIHVSGYKAELRDEEISLRKKMPAITAKYFSDANTNVQVLIMTLNREFRNKSDNALEQNFDLTCIDEAGFLSCQYGLPILLNSNRVILAGDHYQLPPFQTAEVKADLDSYERSILTLMADRYPEEVFMLNQQFRSNQLIMRWSSDSFYRGQLSSAPEVAESKLHHLKGIQKNRWTDANLIFLDTSKRGYTEEDRAPGITKLRPVLTRADVNVIMYDSVKNYDEAFAVAHAVRKFRRFGVRYVDMGVITPYKAQADAVRSLLLEDTEDQTDDAIEDLQISTVDSFQGKEKELIVISMVRSNPRGYLGFVGFPNRLNVTLTRAKKCCVIVGDAQTLNRGHIKTFVRFCEDNDLIMEIEEVFAD